MMPASMPGGFIPHNQFDPCDGDDPRVELQMDNPLQRHPRTRTVDACIKSAQADLDRLGYQQPEGRQ